VQIHHIDENKNNNDIDNLVALCLECHSKVTGNEGLGRKYSRNEIKKYKESWEKKCKELFEAKGQTNYENWEKDDYVVKIEDYEETCIIKPNEHYGLPYDLKENAELKIYFDSELEIDLIIQSEKDYQYWLKKGEIISYEHIEDSKRIKGFLFLTPKEETINILFVNKNKDKTKVNLKIKIWE